MFLKMEQKSRKKSFFTTLKKTYFFCTSSQREGVNKKIYFLENMSPKISPPLNPFRRQKKIYFFISLEPVLRQGWQKRKMGLKKKFSDFFEGGGSTSPPPWCPLKSRFFFIDALPKKGVTFVSLSKNCDNNESDISFFPSNNIMFGSSIQAIELEFLTLLEWIYFYIYCYTLIQRRLSIYS